MPRIYVEWNEGHGPEQKLAVAGQITDAFVEVLGAQPDHIMVVFQDRAPLNVFKGGRTPTPEDARAYVVWHAGRNSRQKAALAKRVTQAIAGAAGVPPQLITVLYHDNDPDEAYKAGEHFPRVGT